MEFAQQPLTPRFYVQKEIIESERIYFQDLDFVVGVIYFYF
jgi:hypothetical protein